MKHSVKIQIIKRNSDAKIFPLRIRVSWAGIRVDIRPGISLPESCWNPTKEIAQTRNAEYKQLCTEANMKLKEVSLKIDELFARCEIMEKREPTVEEVKDVCSEVQESGNTITQVFDRYFQENPQLEPSTVETYKLLRGGLIAYFGKDVDINRITERMMHKFVNYLAETLKNSTIKQRTNLLRAVLKFAKKKNIYSADALEYEFKLKTTPRVIVYLTREELQKFYEYQPQNKYEQDTQSIYLLCCFTGFRISDAIRMRWENVTDNEITKLTKKTSTTVVVELSQLTKSVLARVKDLREREGAGTGPQDRIFPNYRRTSFEDNLRRICKKLGFNTIVEYNYYQGNELKTEYIEKWDFITSHTARKTFVVTALTLEIPIPVVMEWTGHKSMKNLERYTKIVNEVKVRNIKKFDYFIDTDGTQKSTQKKE